MARMTIDDKFGRDPRLLKLAKLCEWSRRETMGCLFDVWSVCYDRESEYLSDVDIDIAAEREGFAGLLMESRLAKPTKRGIRIAGVKDRIKYLRDSRKHGRSGGLKSAETRRNRRPSESKGGSTLPQGSTNLPDSVPDGDVVPDGDGDGESPAEVADAVGELAKRLTHPPPELSIPVDWEPDRTPENLEAAKSAQRRGVVIDYARRKFVERARRLGWTLLEIGFRWREFLATEFPTPDTIRAALTREAREVTSQAARDRERVELEQQKQRAEADREEVRRAAQAALDSNFRLAAEKATA